MVIHFNEDDVAVLEIAKFEWNTWKVGTSYPIGYGSTMMEAIADLQEKIDENMDS